MNQQWAVVQLGFIDATDLSEDDLIVSSSDEEKIVDDVTLSERKSCNDEQITSSEDEALINFANHGYGKKKVKKPVQLSWNLKYNLKYKQDDFLFKVNYEKEINFLMTWVLNCHISYFCSQRNFSEIAQQSSLLWIPLGLIFGTHCIQKSYF